MTEILQSTTGFRTEEQEKRFWAKNAPSWLLGTIFNSKTPLGATASFFMFFSVWGFSLT